MALMMQLLVPGLLPWAFLLPPGVWAGEIFMGWEAWSHSRPYMAFLCVQRSKKTIPCGGFLVAEDFVLTAAHCRGDNITVALGAHNIDKREPNRQVIRVQKQIPHGNYSNRTFHNDIMLLQLNRNVTLTKEVGLINLMTANHLVRPNTMCRVAGWGMTGLNTTTDTLREVNLMVIANDSCVRRYRNYYPSSMLCVGDRHILRSTYSGDSGGPLVCGGVAEGIVSKRKNNSIAPPVVFTRISSFVPWIKANMPRI